MGSTTAASTIIAGTSQDVRSTLGTTGGDQTILLDYVDRIHREILRRSRWQFLLSQPQRFITLKGVTDYWIGATAGNPTTAYDTGLNLTDVRYIADNTVRDLSNNRELQRIYKQPNMMALASEDGLLRLDVPREWRHDYTTPFVIQLYPAADNQNDFRPVPPPPVCTTVNGGALTARTYFVTLTLVDSAGNESIASKETEIYVPANKLVKVLQPNLGYSQSAAGQQYSSYKVYASTDIGHEVVQNTGTAIATSATWTEAVGGLETGTASAPSTNSLEPLDGYVIEFRYFQSITAISATSTVLQVPDDYKDVVISGVNWRAFEFLGRQTEAQLWYKLYQEGQIQILRDLNLAPKGADFIHPDSAAYTTTRFYI